MRYLITGGSGFIGSHLTEALVSEGGIVKILDNFGSGNRDNLSKVLDKIELINGDIRNEELVDQLVSNSDTVFHLAASLGVHNILESPIESISVNIYGSEKVLQSAARHKKRIIIASTSEIYGKNNQQPLSEDSDRLIGRPQNYRWAYSDSKAIEEAMAAYLFQARDLQVTTVRLFNTVGPRQNNLFGMVLPTFIEKALKGEDLIVYGDGMQTRTFCHVTDVVNALIQISKNDKTIGEVFNIGGEGEISILELARKVVLRTNSNSKIVFKSYQDAYPAGFEDMFRRVPDLQKIKNILGWSPAYDLDQIISDTSESIKI